MNSFNGGANGTNVMATSSSTDGTMGAGKSQRAWRKAKTPALAQQMTAEDALAVIVSGCVEHLRGNEECVLRRSHEEGIHQMRVAVRRLRSCLALYRAFIPGEQHDHLNGELKWLIGELGPARDWDVFVHEILSPVLQQTSAEDRLSVLADHVEQRRDEAYARAQTAVRSQRYVGLVLLLGSWAEGRGWNDQSAGNTSPELRERASSVACALLDGIYAELLAAGASFEELDAAHRHEVRIVLKKLRYASEFFSSLFPPRRTAPYIAAMRELQDDLGSSNDVEVARKLLKRVLKGTRGKERAKLAYAAGLVVGWHSHIGDDRELRLVHAWQRFVARRPYWPAGRTADAARAGTGDDPHQSGAADEALPAQQPQQVSAEEPEPGAANAVTPAPSRRRQPERRPSRR